jgi:3',5'-cyclic AMP phosphodiesterase CpdA
LLQTIAHLSDLHFGRIEPGAPAAVIEDVASCAPDCIVITGDFTQRARVGQFRKAIEFLLRLPEPRLVIPGNHDVPLWNIVRRFFSPLGRYQRFICSDLQPSLLTGELQVVGLNTTRRCAPRLRGFWKDGLIRMPELERALRAFGAPAGQGCRILATHHPLIEPSPDHAGDVARNANAAIPRLIEAGVELCLSGHLHLSYHRFVQVPAFPGRGLLCIHAGTATSSRRRDGNNAWNLIRVARESIHLQVRALVGGRFMPISEHEFPRSPFPQCHQAL